MLKPRASLMRYGGRFLRGSMLGLEMALDVRQSP